MTSDQISTGAHEPPSGTVGRCVKAGGEKKKKEKKEKQQQTKSVGEKLRRIVGVIV